MKQGDLDFDEFCDAYNAMIDKLGDLHASIREKAIQQSMILGMAQDDDTEYEELLEQTKGRFDKPTWICRLEELLGAREGGNVLERARAKGKLPICFKHPDQDLDDVTQYFSKKAGGGSGLVSIVDLQEMIMQMGSRTPRNQDTPPT